MSSKKTVTLAMTYLGHTDAAVHLEDPDDLQTYWLPLSQCDVGDVDELDSGEMVDAVVPLWLAEKKGLA